MTSVKAKSVDFSRQWFKVLPQESDENTTLPPGYAIVMNLYKDLHFMNNVRFRGANEVNDYLRKNHPDVVNYLKAHGLRVVTQVVGKSAVGGYLAKKDEPPSEPPTTCTVSVSSAAAAASSDAVAVARAVAVAKAIAAAASAAAVAVSANVTACSTTYSNGVRSNG